ncbi:MAG: UPF0489 family protein [Treponema sp.]|nr:UPF0489 family protein [Treponema sp.]
MSIPVYIMEEHHEAFYYWNYFVHKGYIPAKGNYLLHIDHHDDYESGGYDIDFAKLHKGITLEEAKEITYSKLGIADFIVPAAFEGLFATVHIMKNLIPRSLKDVESFVRCSYNCELRQGTYIPFLYAPNKKAGDPDFAFYTERRGGLKDLSIPEGQKVVLDVDLDYFCWDDSLKSTPRKLLEITKEAYEDVTNNPYNPFRILPRKLLDAVEIDGHYYIEYKEKIHREKPADDEKIAKRITRLVTWLKETNIDISVIDVCRSNISGYLPADAFPFVEQEFLRQMDGKFGIEIKKIGE